MSMTTGYCDISLVSLIQSTSLYPVPGDPLYYSSPTYSYAFQAVFFSSDFQTVKFCMHFLYLIRTHSLYSITIIILSEESKHEDPHYVVFPTLLLFPLSGMQTLSSALYAQTLIVLIQEQLKKLALKTMTPSELVLLHIYKGVLCKLQDIIRVYTRARQYHHTLQSTELSKAPPSLSTSTGFDP
jgi:hypothetical protein